MDDDGRAAAVSRYWTEHEECGHAYGATQAECEAWHERQARDAAAAEALP